MSCSCGPFGIEGDATLTRHPDAAVPHATRDPPRRGARMSRPIIFAAETGCRLEATRAAPSAAAD